MNIQSSNHILQLSWFETEQFTMKKQTSNYLHGKGAKKCGVKDRRTKKSERGKEKWCGGISDIWTGYCEYNTAYSNMGEWDSYILL